MKASINVVVKVVLVSVVLGLLIGVSSATWWNASWTNAKDITLVGTDTEQTNFPYLVSVAKVASMQSDYDDLRFVDDTTPIDYEIECYNATNATVWLNITTLPVAGKTIKMYYGNSTVVSTANSNATWNSDYVGVWHLADKNIVPYSWNDYKQPEGVITANASQYYILAEPSVLYEDSKFKMWMRERHTTPPVVDYLGYWESSDGYDWNQIATGLLEGGAGVNRCRHPFVMKDPNSSGYWLYNYNESTTNEDLWYGTNETDWSIDTWGIFSASDVGGASFIGNVFVWRENTSDWYAIVENNAPTWTSDYATSNDGKSWTFHGQVTVSGFGSNSLSGPQIHKNNGTYYMWFHGNKATQGGIPSDTYVATCTDRQSWVYQSGFEITREWNWEGVGQPGGQLADPTFAEKDGELYIFTQSAHDQSPGATWPHRIGLCHLNESLQEVCDHIDAGITTPKVSDSTSNGRDGTQTDIASSTDGAIGSCMEFDGDSSYIDLGTPFALTDGTHEWWCNASTISATVHQSYSHNIATGGTPCTIHRFVEVTGVDKMRAYIGGAWFSDASAVPNNYYHVALVSNSSGNDLWYVNGALFDSKTHGTGHAADFSGWYIGASRTPDNWFGGKMDEIRVSDIIRCADWINLSYQMVVNSSYVTFGGEESNVTSTTPVISNVQNGSISPTSQYINWTVNQTAHNRVLYSNESDLTPTYYSTWDNSTAAPNITLSGLEASTQYWYQAWSYNTSNTSLSDNSSTLSFTTTGVDTSFTVTLPAGYTYLRFEPTNSTSVNVTPNGQTDSQEFYNVTNTGAVNLDVRMQLNETITNIVLKADSDNTPSGSVEVNTTLVTIYTNVVPTNTADIWMWSDFTYAVEQDTNKTLSINVSQST